MSMPPRKYSRAHFSFEGDMDMSQRAEALAALLYAGNKSTMFKVAIREQITRLESNLTPEQRSLYERFLEIARRGVTGHNMADAINGAGLYITPPANVAPAAVQEVVPSVVQEVVPSVVQEVVPSVVQEVVQPPAEPVPAPEIVEPAPTDTPTQGDPNVTN